MDNQNNEDNENTSFLANDANIEQAESGNNIANRWSKVLDYKKLRNAFRLLSTSCLIIILSLLLFSKFKAPDSILDKSISSHALNHGYKQCKIIRQLNSQRKEYTEYINSGYKVNINKSRKNSRFINGTKPIVIKAVTIWDSLNNDAYNSDILIENGIIKEIGRFIMIPKEAIVINGKNKIVTPGLIDMHSHIGVGSWPTLQGTTDADEATRPNFPGLKTIDAFSQDDLAIPIVMSGGVTSTLVLPGSANLIGGEAFVVKLSKSKNLSNEELLVNFGQNDNEIMNWRYMKFACGENPKGVYGAKSQTPSTRMGSAYLLREIFTRANKLVQQQDDWCNYLIDHFNEVDINNGKVHSITKEFPEDMGLESLSHVVRGNVQPHIHCYEPEDIESMIKLSKDFNFQIWAFHHALSAYRVPSMIKKAGRDNFTVTIATFSDTWGYKKESYEASIKAPKILAENHIPVAIKSDHPILNSHDLMMEATKAYHNGLDAKLALISVTSTPAKALGLAHRIGSIQTNMDADLVLWDKIPLSIGSTPNNIIIDGKLMFEYEQVEDISINSYDYENPINYPINLSTKNHDKCEFNGLKEFILKGVDKVILNNTKQSIQIYNKDYLLVKDGKITKIDTIINNNLKVIDLEAKAWILPGLIAVGSKLGLNEILLEPSTGDGYINDLDPLKIDEFPTAKDGLNFNGKHLNLANKMGILSAISAPLVQSGIIAGYSAAFFTNGESNEDGIVNPISALHLNVGYEYLSPSIPTISLQFNKIRQMFFKAIEIASKDWNQSKLMIKVIKGDIPTVIRVDNKDDISRLINLRNEIRNKFHQLGGLGTGLDLIILGGAEAWAVASQLVTEDVKVILQPARCVPDTWSKRRCLTGAPLTQNTTFSVLYDAGVKIGFAPSYDNRFPRDIIDEATWAFNYANGDINEVDALALVSWNLFDMFHLHNDEQFLVWDKSPFEMGANKLFAYSKRKGIMC